MKEQNNKLQKKRYIIQIVFILIVFSIVLFKFLDSKGIDLPFSASGFHGLCPFGAVAAAGRFFMHGKFIPETQPSNFWMFFSVSVLTIIFGKVFCGWFCPLGSVQEFIYNKTGKLRESASLKLPLKIKNSRFPKRIILLMNNVFSFIKYAVLIMIIVRTTKEVSLIFGRIDPYYALFNFWTGDVLLTAIVVLASVLILSVFIYRPWCRWFCPLGAMLGIIQFFSFYKIKRNKDLCINCGLCSKNCPQNIIVAEKITVFCTECIKCGKCVSSCPVTGVLNDYSLFRRLKGVEISRKKVNENTKEDNSKKEKIFNNRYFPVLILLVFFIPVLYGKYFSNFYHRFDYENKIPAVSSQLENVSDNTAGKTELLKSSMTLEELSLQMNISEDELKKYLGINSLLDSSIKLRDIEDFEPGATFKVIKMKVSEYM